MLDHSTDHVSSILRTLYEDYRELLPIDSSWEDEKDRWHELVFCIVAELSEHGISSSRSLITHLAELNLLDPDELARAVASDGEFDRTNEAASRLVGILTINGMPKETADEVVLTVCEAARGMQVRNEKIQGFLRRHAQQMVSEMSEGLDFSSISRDRKQRILTWWLQNILEMPLLVEDASVTQFCQENNCSPKDVIGVADEFDINVRVVDDLIHCYMLDQPQS